MYILISVPNEAFHRVMTARALQQKLGVEASVYRDASDLLRRMERTFGGRIVLLDWSRREIVADTRLDGAIGLAVGENAVYCGSWTGNCIECLERNGSRRVITHPWLNHLHTLEFTGAGTLMVASAGADLILEMSLAGEVLWHWFGPDHGFAPKTPGPASHFDPEIDYRLVRRSTAARAMHVTAALPVGDSQVLATLFHQGQLIRIDRKTGDAEIVLDGLVRPHGIHRRPGGFLLSDTLGHRIVLLNEALQVCSEIPFGTQWLQDTALTSAGTYVTLQNVHIDQMPETGLSNHIIEIDRSGMPLCRIDVPADHRLFTVKEIPEATAQWMISAWGRSAELGGWKWN